MEEFTIKLNSDKLVKTIHSLQKDSNDTIVSEIIEQLKMSLKVPPRVIDIEYIIKVVCQYFGITKEEMFLNTRKREIVQARKIAMFYAKKITKLSLADIGNNIGGKDHATVLHACKTVNDNCDTDAFYKFKVDEIAHKLDPQNNKQPALVNPIQKYRLQNIKIIRQPKIEETKKYQRPTYKIGVFKSSTQQIIDKYENQPTFRISGLH